MDKWLTDHLAALGVERLTTVQKMAIDSGVASGQSIVVCAPTSSGKTLIGEIAMLAGVRTSSTALYLVSHKALADQKFDEFKQKYGKAGRTPAARVAISTGDREDGDDNPQLLIATYEKALSLVMSGAVTAASTVVVADELQIVGEDKRGPEVEILCAALLRRKPKQIVALTATVENGDDIAAWLECKLVKSSVRDVDLVQEIWTQDQIYAVRHGDVDGQVRKRGKSSGLDTLEVLNDVLAQRRAPVLVFVETRADAMHMASAFAAQRAKTPSGFNLSEQLSLFSEETEFSGRLRQTAETKVVFHTADLTPSERAVVEKGLITSNFDVCFATPTLAAGVNFPFRTVIFDRIRRRYLSPPFLPLSAYRNMSGRAGRLGLHDKGFSVLVPKDAEELQHANTLVGAENERLHSKLPSVSMRKLVLALVASKTADSAATIRKFLEKTLFWHQVRDRNAKHLDDIVKKVDAAIDWLLEHRMISRDEEVVAATDLGNTTARTGLLPSSAYALATLLSEHSRTLEEGFEDLELPLIQATCCSDEFAADIGQRFLPPVSSGIDDSQVRHAFHGLPTLLPTRNAPRGNAAFAVYLFASGEAERRISAYSGIPSGQVHRFAGDIAWILEGMARIAAVPSVGCPQRVMNSVSLLARRVRLGVPAELVDLLETAQKAQVPGFGRQRAMALLKAKLADRTIILGADRALLESILANKERVDRLIDAIERLEPSKYESTKRLHIRIAEKLGIANQVRDAYDKNGTDYELAVEALLRLDTAWKITRLDDGRRQGVPDLMIQFKGKAIVAECKSTTKKPPNINKEEAFAVLTKAADIKDVHCVTIGKPGFDTFSRSKACASSEITLVDHATLAAALLMRRKGVVTLEKLFEWLREPGVAEVERLGVLEQRD